MKPVKKNTKASNNIYALYKFIVPSYGLNILKIIPAFVYPIGISSFDVVLFSTALLLKNSFSENSLAAL